MSFTDNGDPLLSDGSLGSGVNPATLSSPETFTTDGSHTACGMVSDNVGNTSELGCLTVQVDATPPSVEVNCPVMVSIGAAGVDATVVASDGQSGLAVDPSGSVPINTSKAGPVTVTRTAIDNVGHETTAACTTEVGYTQVITGNVKGPEVVKAGQAVELTGTAKVSGTLTVKAGGAVDVEGATVSGALSANGATLVRVCGASISGATKVVNSTGSVVIGEGSPSCSASTLHGGVTIKANKASVLVDENSFGSMVNVQSNSDGVSITNNTIAGSLTVKNNTGTVHDEPNEVEGKSKLQ